MKKIKRGCFIGLLLVLTVVITIIVYFFKYHKNEVEGIFKPIALSSLRNDVFEKLDKIKDDQYKDSLKSIVSDYITQIKSRENFDMEKAGDFFKNVKIMLSDGNIDSLEITSLRKLLITNMVEYERSKKN